MRTALVITIVLAAVADRATGQIIGGGGGKTDSAPRHAPRLQGGADPALGDKAVAEGRFADAVRIYSDAIRKNPGRAELSLYLRLGDAANTIAGDDMANALQARVAWESAMKEYPQAPEPLQRLIRFYVDYAEISALDTRIDLLRRAGAAAEKLVALDPGDHYARFVIQRTVIEQFLSDKLADIDAVNAAIGELSSLAPLLPDNLDVLYLKARAQAKLGTNDLRFGRVTEGTAHLRNALATIDAAMTAEPDSAGMLFRKAQLLQASGPAIFDSSGGTDPTSAAAARERLGRESAELLAGAIGLLKENDPDLEPIVSFAVRIQRASGNDQLAESILRAVIAARPRAVQPRLQLAELLLENPERVEEILPVLEPAAVVPTSRIGIAGIVAADGYRQVLMAQARTRIELIERLQSQKQDPAAASAAAEQMRKLSDELAILSARNAQAAPRVLRLLARRAMLDNDLPKAEQLLLRAIAVARELDESLHVDTITLLGRLKLRAGDKPAAIKLFDEAIIRTDYVPARIELAELLLADKQFADARPHLDKLKETSLEEPRVQQMQATVLKWESRGDSAMLATLLNQMPEQTIDQHLNKIAVASRVGLHDSALQLLDPLLKQYPNQPQLVLLHSDILISSGRQSDAVQLLQNYMTANPSALQVAARLRAIEAL